MMAALFLFAALLQYNDPDPARWMAIYAAAMFVSGYAAWRGSVPSWAPLAVALIALIWGLDWSTDVPGLETYTHMFDSWEMKNAAVEEARETGGLLIVTGWMLTLTVDGWRRLRARRNHRHD
jgi:hypothetical protein